MAMEEHTGEAIQPAEEQQVQEVAQPQETEAKPKVAKGPGIIARFLATMKRFSIECKRVLKITKKPDGAEFKTIVKISGAGMLIIGFIGFVLHVIRELLKSL